MAKIKYNRISSATQHLTRQEVDNGEYDKVYTDIASGKNTNRPQFKAMMEFVREGDELHIDSYSRLARDTKDLLNIVETLNKKGVIIISKKEGLDTSTPTGKLMLTIFSGLYQFEREQMLERQREAYEALRQAGGNVGRPRKEADKAFMDAVKLWRAGEINGVEATKKSGMSKALFYRRVKELGL